MGDRTHTRRAVLAALPATAATVLVPGAAMSQSVPAPSPRLARLWAMREAAIAAREREGAAEEAALERYRSLCPALPDELQLTWRVMFGLPIEHSWLHELHGDGRFMIATEHWRTMMKRLGDDVAEGRLDVVKSRLALSEGHDREVAAVARACGLDEANEASGKAFDRLGNVEDAIIAAPVVTFSDLAIKARVLQQSEGLIAEDDVARVLADIVLLAYHPTA